MFTEEKHLQNALYKYAFDFVETTEMEAELLLIVIM